MRAVVQRVAEARVMAEGEIVSGIQKGLLVFLGIAKGDGEEQAQYICSKIAALRIFSDENDRMNFSVRDVGGSVLLVSQFTLYGDCRKGNRPNFMASERPIEAKKLYERCIRLLQLEKVEVRTGVFQADMQVHSVNDGPVTVLLDSDRGF